MGSRGKKLSLLLAALAVAAACATASQAAGLQVLWLKSGNHTSSARAGSGLSTGS